jgi:ribonuclease HII
MSEHTYDYSILDKKTRSKKTLLLAAFDTQSDTYELGIDEAGRGPLMGRVYSAAVVLPKDECFRHDWMQDSKKFTKWEKLKTTEQYIKQHALAYSIQYEDENGIDKINILQATYKCMQKCVHDITLQLETTLCHLLVDGTNFKPYIIIDDDEFKSIQHTCIKSGDNTFSSIAAASILAKVARDEYIDDLCKENPLLDTYYGISSNKGYGSKKHRDGIKEHGISKWHRKSYGICKDNLDRIW